MKLLLASNNQHKVNEFRDCLGSFTIVTPDELGIQFDHEETALTFRENALGKGFALYQALAKKGPVPKDLAIIADDSGICIDALDGEPGIYSARYGSQNGINLSSYERNSLVLSKMQGSNDRAAHFVCALALVWDMNRFALVQETLCGSVTREISSGSNGFGYDPIFWLDEHECTVADLDPLVKNQVSHRGKAAKALSRIIINYKELP